MNVLDLFSGIGGFALGLERAGMKTAAFCEIDEAARKVLQHRFPNIPIFEDVSSLTKETLDNHGITVDVIVGGFPCQDISVAGKGAGLAGARSGLWFEFHRLIKEIQPRFIIAENVSALRSKGLDEVLRSLSEIGYDAEWHCISASAVGAPHQRDRIWIVAYPGGERRIKWGGSGEERPILFHPEWSPQKDRRYWSQRVDRIGENGSTDVRPLVARWEAESGILGVCDGVPNRVDRIKQLGNAVVPQIPELIGKAILERSADDQRT